MSADVSVDIYVWGNIEVASGIILTSVAVFSRRLLSGWALHCASIRTKDHKSSPIDSEATVIAPVGSSEAQHDTQQARPLSKQESEHTVTSDPACHCHLKPMPAFSIVPMPGE